MKQITILTLIILFLFSCQNQDDRIYNQGNDIYYKTASTKRVDNHFTISAISIAGKLSQVDFSQYFMNEKGKEEDLLILGNFKNEFINSNLGDYNNHENFSINRLNEKFGLLKDSFGRSIDLKPENSSESDEIYIPKLLTIENTSVLNEIDKDNGFSINWNADNENANGKVTIVIINRGKINNNSGSKVKNISYSNIIDDTGSYNVSSNDLGIFDADSNIDIVLSRGNQILLNNTALTVVTSDLYPAKIK